ncbi:hypothetical protein [Longimicrobium sp.]|uniref:hypothetical protein n=1 Tax=Longimicrobium sp. TaxID=2029185 RepID=UPI002E3558CE|nr:hypothetical protein [Longimicrobium sp.]HEX6039210.1 hypothetical protein [Longimicrobium sp.]
MTDSEFETLRARVERLERERDSWKRHTWRAGALCALLAAVVLGAARPAARPEPSGAMPADSVLRVRGLVVVDAQGVERVIIGAPVPDPRIYGRRSTRLGTASGIVLLDADGNERSGYLTSDEVGEVFLTLDAAARQQALFLANATGGAQISVWDAAGSHAQMGAVGRPWLTLRGGGRVVASLPDTTGGGR